LVVFGGVQSTHAQTLPPCSASSQSLPWASIQGVNTLGTIIIALAFIMESVVALNRWLEKQAERPRKPSVIFI
jgi:hypothetical protein